MLGLSLAVGTATAFGQPPPSPDAPKAEKERAKRRIRETAKGRKGIRKSKRTRRGRHNLQRSNCMPGRSRSIYMLPAFSNLPRFHGPFQANKKRSQAAQNNRPHPFNHLRA